MIHKCSIKILLFVLLAVTMMISCKKDSFITSSSAKISTSVDSLHYDTVFTTIGSITQSFKIFNLNNQKLLISQIKLMGGDSSAFKININGIASSSASNIEVSANDSIYIFVMVTINPASSNLPFLVNDSILISYNGNKKFVQLQAYGQNAYFLKGKEISTNTTFSVDKPYVILDSLKIDSNTVLTLPAGCKIYAHADAPILVDGTVLANGQINNPVVFKGDRLDQDYSNLPASWPGIYFRTSSKNNNLIFTGIYNANDAVVLTGASSNANPKLTLSKCIINNASDAGIECVGSSMLAENCLISNCGSNINITYGGSYSLINCTVASYGNTYIQHNNPVFSATDFTNLNGLISTNNLYGQFINCIFWGANGNVSNEISISERGTNFNVAFTNCLYKAANDPSNTTLTNNVKNLDPIFDSIDVINNYYDFHTKKNSAAPGIGAGITTSYPIDLDNKTRIGNFDIGCYQK